MTRLEAETSILSIFLAVARDMVLLEMEDMKMYPREKCDKLSHRQANKRGKRSRQIRTKLGWSTLLCGSTSRVKSDAR